MNCSSTYRKINIPVNTYLIKVNKRNTRKRYERCSKLTIQTPERRNWRSCCVFIANFDHILHLLLVFPLLTLNEWIFAYMKALDIKFFFYKPKTRTLINRDPMLYSPSFAKFGRVDIAQNTCERLLLVVLDSYTISFNCMNLINYTL